MKISPEAGLSQRGAVSPLAEPWTQSPAADVGLSSTAQLMLFRPGLYSIGFAARHAVRTDIGLQLPCVRLDPVPPAGPEDGRAFVSMSAEGGWISRASDRVFVLVAGGTARVILTIYKAGPDAPAPEIRIDNVTQDALLPGSGGARADAGLVEPALAGVVAGLGEIQVAVVVHATGAGDLPGVPGGWAGIAGASMEGFTLSIPDREAGETLEYQAILGVDWDTPWLRAGEFCGSRGLSLALRGFRIKPSEALARTHRCVYWGTFRGGVSVGPFADGEACAAGNAELETMRVVVEQRERRKASRRSAGRAGGSGGPT